MNHQEYRRVVNGSDTGVLMIHGIVGTPDHFNDLISIIPDSWSVSNLLLEGHGKGVAEFSASSMRKWKAQVNRELEQLLTSHRQILIVAHSMGTLFAIQAAIDYPDRVAGLFLLAVPMRPFVRWEAAWASVKLVLGIVGEDRTALAMQKDCSVKLDKRLWQYLLWVPRFVELLVEIRRIRCLLPRLAVPTLAFQSCRDELVSNYSCRDLAGHDYIRVIAMKYSGHFSYEAVDQVRLLSHFRKIVENL